MAKGNGDNKNGDGRLRRAVNLVVAVVRAVIDLVLFWRGTR